MRARRTISLLAALALLSPLTATAMPGCGPDAPMPHCPMMAALAAEDVPCHGTAMEADDCCPDMSAGEPAAAPPVIGAPAFEAAPAPLAAAAPSGRSPVASRSEAASPPLYRLHRALLI